MSGKHTLADYFVEYVPEECRDAHEMFAKELRYFWLPCPLCGAHFGGHEWRDIDGKTSHIPDPGGEPGCYTGICPACTRAGRGQQTMWASVDTPRPSAGDGPE